MKFKFLLLAFALTCRLVSQINWQLRPMVESKMHVNFSSLPLSFSDSVNSFTYVPQPYLVTSKINYGVSICGVFKRFTFETGLIYDHVSFKYRLEVMSAMNSYTHVSFQTITYYKVPLKISLLIAGRDSVKPGKKLYSKIHFLIGKDIRLVKLKDLFVSSKKQSQDNKSIIKETNYGNSELVHEELYLNTPRYLANLVGLSYALYNKRNKNILNISLFYSFYLRGNYLYGRTRFYANNRSYFLTNYVSGNALYLTFTKELNLNNYFVKRKKSNKKT